ncbi:protein-tyrosine phosphatase-like protein [Choanephora cucurbitarum]|nr:protein-tyrosine phosphatase-like protein [Choanephora cucurbitarum]
MSTKFESPTSHTENGILSSEATPINYGNDSAAINGNDDSNYNNGSNSSSGLKSNFHKHENDEFRKLINTINTRPFNWIAPTASPIYHRRHIEDLAPIECKLLNQLLEQNNQAILIVDVRSSLYYSKNRIRSAIHLSLPTVLLKRPNYTVDKICDSISDPEAAQRLKNWQQTTHVIFYDHSAYKPTESSNSATATLLGSKLRNEGYKGQLNHLQGGFFDFNQNYPHQCEFFETNDSKTPTPMATIKRDNKPQNIALPTLNINSSEAANPFFSNIRQNMELSHGPIQERIHIRLPSGFSYKNGSILYSSNRSPSSQDSQSSVEANTHYHPRFGLAGSSVDCDGNLELPNWLQKVIDPINGSKKLAAMYEQLERTEQKRLSTIMNYHTKATEDSIDPSRFPLSITSSMEKGALNRYDNIWPYEYSRVKLNENDDDYINANHVQFANIMRDITQSPLPQSTQEASLEEKGLLSEASIQTMKPSANKDLSTSRPYICTQGPLPTTFGAFWKMIWDQESFVIVMLTQELEMNKMKCHRYWPSVVDVPQDYDAFTVTLKSEYKQAVVNINDKRERIYDGLDEECIIIRTIHIKHNVSDIERTITHLQYTGWTDFGVPDYPIGILQLVSEADEAYARYQTDSLGSGPMIVHCSAGCGRSGTFCVIDTMIQRLWHDKDVYTSSTQDKLWETIYRFREQRMSMVQTHRQFVFCYESILWWMLGYGNLPALATTTTDSDMKMLPS